MRNRRLPGSGLAAIALGLGTLIGPGPAIATQRPGAGASGPCGAFPGAHQLPGAVGVTVIKNGTPHRPPVAGDARRAANLRHAEWAWHHPGVEGW